MTLPTREQIDELRRLEAAATKAPWPPPNPFAKSPGRPAGELLKIPVTLPSLKVAWLEIPFPLSEAEYEALSTALTTFKQAMTTTTTTTT